MTAGASAPEELVDAVIAVLAPEQGVERVRVTDEDEYFPPPPELRELVPALDALAALAFGGDPQAARGAGRAIRRRPRGRRRRDARQPRRLAERRLRPSRSSYASSSTTCSASASVAVERVDLVARHDAARARPRARSARPTTIVTRPNRGIGSFCVRRISSVPAIPTGTIGTPARSARYAAPGWSGWIFGPCWRVPFGIHAQHLARLRASPSTRARPCGRCRRARPGIRRAQRKNAPSTGTLNSDALPMNRIRRVRDERRERDVHHRPVRRREHEAARLRARARGPTTRTRHSSRGITGRRTGERSGRTSISRSPPARARSTSSPTTSSTSRPVVSITIASSAARNGETARLAVERVAPVERGRARRRPRPRAPTPPRRAGGAAPARRRWRSGTP